MVAKNDKRISSIKYVDAHFLLRVINMLSEPEGVFFHDDFN